MIIGRNSNIRTIFKLKQGKASLADIYDSKKLIGLLDFQ